MLHRLKPNLRKTTPRITQHATSPIVRFHTQLPRPIQRRGSGHPRAAGASCRPRLGLSRANVRRARLPERDTTRGRLGVDRTAHVASGGITQPWRRGRGLRPRAGWRPPYALAHSLQPGRAGAQRSRSCPVSRPGRPGAGPVPARGALDLRRTPGQPRAHASRPRRRAHRLCSICTTSATTIAVGWKTSTRSSSRPSIRVSCPSSVVSRSTGAIPK